MSTNDEADKLADELQSKLHVTTANNNDAVTNSLKRMAKWIQEAENILVLTGAGVVRKIFAHNDQ